MRPVKVSRSIPIDNGWVKFNLNVGGFLVKNCRWHPQRRSILFPVRFDLLGRRQRVASAHGVLINRLRDLLESGETAAPRDRTPCTLKITYLDLLPDGWCRFNFTVRGFTFYRCRWQPQTGSIQLPVTFFGESKKRVICAYGVHINRLRKALEEYAARIGSHECFAIRESADAEVYSA